MYRCPKRQRIKLMYAGCNGPPSLNYKREGKGWILVFGLGTELLLFYRRSLSLCSAGFKRLPLFRGKPECFRQRLHRTMCVCVCAGSRAWSLTGLPIVILITIVFVMFINRILVASSLCICVRGSAVVFVLLLPLFCLFLGSGPSRSRLNFSGTSVTTRQREGSRAHTHNTRKAYTNKARIIFVK